MFKKATKKSTWLRTAIYGPSGAGKTYSALRIAKGIGLRTALIDTERRSASKYSDKFEFDVCELEDRTIDGYCKAIAAAGKAGYGILIIDSLTHGWQELLAEIDALATTKYKGNTWSAWSQGTPKQRALVDAILGFRGHVIATMRAKTEWKTVDVAGKSKPQRVGLAPEQGKGIEYEFDQLIEVSPEHSAEVVKDRSGLYQDKVVSIIDEAFGATLAGWLGEGDPIEAPEAHPVVRTVAKTFGATVTGVEDADERF